MMRMSSSTANRSSVYWYATSMVLRGSSYVVVRLLGRDEFHPRQRTAQASPLTLLSFSFPLAPLSLARSTRYKYLRPSWLIIR